MPGRLTPAVKRTWYWLVLCGAALGAGPCGGEPTAPPPTVASVTLAVTSTNPRVGEVSHVVATPVNSGGVKVQGVTCKYVSSAPAVAAVDSLSGDVTGRSFGDATITATCGGKAASVVISVRPRLVTLTIFQAGNGSGAVFASPGQVLGYDEGTTVTITAIPTTIGSGASLFVGWSDACAAAGVATTCTIKMDANKTVTATFIKPIRFFAGKAGDGDGNLAADPPGWSLPAALMQAAMAATTGAATLGYAPGTRVTFTATPSTGSVFAGWSDACQSAGTAPTCIITAVADATVTANFSLAPTTYKGNFSGTFGNFSNYDGCTWRATLSGPQTAVITQSASGAVSGTSTATVNIGIAVVSGPSCGTAPSSFNSSVAISGTTSSMTWTFTGAQSFSMAFTGSLSGSTITGSASATRTFVGSGNSGTLNTTLSTQLPGLTLTKQ